MPYKIKKLRDQNFYKVVNKDGKSLAKKTTDNKAKKMIKLLNYVDAKKYKKKIIKNLEYYLIPSMLLYKI